VAIGARSESMRERETVVSIRTLYSEIAPPLESVHFEQLSEQTRRDEPL